MPKKAKYPWALRSKIDGELLALFQDETLARMALLGIWGKKALRNRLFPFEVARVDAAGRPYHA